MKKKPDPALPLEGERRKASARPRTEGVTRLNGRKCFYARIWKGKRARYISTRVEDVTRAQELMDHIRALVKRGAAVTRESIFQPELPL